MRDELTKKYSNQEITVVWKPRLCIHSGNCWKGLRSVFDPQQRPWIKMDGATTEQIVAQVNKCPSGALSYYRNQDNEKSPDAPAQTVIEPSPNGPLNITGEVLVKLRDGTEQICGPKTSLCRCGQSGNKPFCDGSHTKTGFKG